MIKHTFSVENYTKCKYMSISTYYFVGVTSHRFPNPQLFLTQLVEWMKLVGIENEDPNLVYYDRRICAAHFTTDCSSPGTKCLNANAYPTLNMSGNL